MEANEVHKSQSLGEPTRINGCNHQRSPFHPHREGANLTAIGLKRLRPNQPENDTCLAFTIDTSLPRGRRTGKNGAEYVRKADGKHLTGMTNRNSAEPFDDQVSPTTSWCYRCSIRLPFEVQLELEPGGSRSRS